MIKTQWAASKAGPGQKPQRPVAADFLPQTWSGPGLSRVFRLKRKHNPLQVTSFTIVITLLKYRLFQSKK
jgi:hypothetical protein